MNGEAYVTSLQEVFKPNDGRISKNIKYSIMIKIVFYCIFNTLFYLWITVRIPIVFSSQHVAKDRSYCKILFLTKDKLKLKKN